MSKTNYQRAVSEFAGAFSRSVRSDGGEYYKLNDGAPDWLQGSDVMLAVHQALDDRMPDDWVYKTAASVAENLRDYDRETADESRDDVGEIADSLVDVSNADRLQWLSSHLRNAALCDEAANELGDPGDTFQRIGLGQYWAIERIAFAIIDACEERASDLADEE